MGSDHSELNILDSRVIKTKPSLHPIFKWIKNVSYSKHKTTSVEGEAWIFCHLHLCCLCTQLFKVLNIAIYNGFNLVYRGIYTYTYVWLPSILCFYWWRGLVWGSRVPKNGLERALTYIVFNVKCGSAWCIFKAVYSFIWYLSLLIWNY